MSQIDLKLTELINKVEASGRTGGVRFVREFGAQPVEAPLTGYIAAVGYSDLKQSKSFLGGLLSPEIKGEVFLATAQIILYAPPGENGSGLSQLAAELIKELKKADTDGIITEPRAYPIAFEPDLNTVCRKIEFKLEFCLLEDGDNE